MHDDRTRVIAHVHKNKATALKAIEEVREVGGSDITVTGNIVSYNGVVLYFVGVDDVFTELANISVDAVRYHNVEPNERVETFLLDRMNSSV